MHRVALQSIPKLMWWTGAMAVFVAAVPGLAQQYTITDLGVLPGLVGCSASAINSQGQVVGFCFGLLPKTDVGFIWTDGDMEPIVSSQDVTGINSAGRVILYLVQASRPPFFAYSFLWEAGQATNLGNLGGMFTFAYGINESAQIVGKGSTADGSFYHAFVWTDGTMTDLGLGSAGAFGINDVGQIVGYFDREGIGTRAFLLNGDDLLDLGTLLPTDTFSIAYGINNAGQVIGESSPGYQDQSHGFLWDNGVMQELPPLPGDQVSHVKSINTWGDVVGGSAPAPNLSCERTLECHAVLWQCGMAFDLNDLIAADSGWVLDAATGINDAGQIVGVGRLTGPARAFLLTPIEDPESRGPSR